MANATTSVKKKTKSWIERFDRRSVETLAAETTFYIGAMIGIDSTGYFCKFDDTQSAFYHGLVRGEGGNPVLPVGTAGDQLLELDVHMPPIFQLAIASIAVTDAGKTAYATFDQTGTLDYSATTYANVVGRVWGVAASGIAWVEPFFGGPFAANVAAGAAKRLAATGAQTISKFDCGKVLFCANTAALTLTLPAIADCPAGWWLKFVKDHASDTNALTLDGNAAEEINGAATLATMDAPYDTVTLISNGERWVIDDNVA